MLRIQIQYPTLHIISYPDSIKGVQRFTLDCMHFIHPKATGQRLYGMQPEVYPPTTPLIEFYFLCNQMMLQCII